MNTSYTTAIPLFGTTPAGVDLEQLIIAPTFAWKINPSNAVGISLNFAYQSRFGALAERLDPPPKGGSFRGFTRRE